MSKVAKVAMALLSLTGAALIVIAYWTGRDSTDAQQALVIPFLVLWTLLAVAGVWVLDRAIRALRRRFGNP